MTPKFRFRILTQGLSLNRGQELWITEQFLSPCGPVPLQFIIPVSPTRWGLPGSSSGCHQALTLSFSQQETPGEICFSSLIAKQMGCNVPLNIFISAGVGSKGKLVGLRMGGRASFAAYWWGKLQKVPQTTVKILKAAPSFTCTHFHPLNNARKS